MNTHRKIHVNLSYNSETIHTEIVLLLIVCLQYIICIYNRDEERESIENSHVADILNRSYVC